MQASLPENINSANYSALKICDLIPGIYQRHYISIELITDLSFVIFAHIYLSVIQATLQMHLSFFTLKCLCLVYTLRIWVLKDPINPLAALSDHFICNTIHFLTSYLPFPILRKSLILFYCISLHNTEFSPFQPNTSLCVSCRNLRLGEIFSHLFCGKALFWHFTRTASRIQIRTSHSQRKILTLRSTIFPTNFFFASSPPKWTKLNQGHPVKQSFAVCFIFSNTYISSEMAVENFWNNQSFILYLLISKEKLN